MSDVTTVNTDLLWKLSHQVEDELMKLREVVALLHCAHVGRNTMDEHAGSEIPLPYAVDQYFDHGVAALVDDIDKRATGIVDLVMKGGNAEDAE